MQLLSEENKSKILKADDEINLEGTSQTLMIDILISKHPPAQPAEHHRTRSMRGITTPLKCFQYGLIKWQLVQAALKTISALRLVKADSQQVS